MTQKATTPFQVSTELVTLGVTVRGEAVTSIVLHGRAGRGPQGVFEQRVAAELTEYLAGSRREFSVPVKPSGTPFEQETWRELQRIPYGDTRTYGDVASAVGRPRAARAVGAANHKNPIPIIIPCHRVVAAGGGLGGYGGGLDLKRRLLALEQRAL